MFVFTLLLLYVPAGGVNAFEANGRGRGKHEKVRLRSNFLSVSGSICSIAIAIA
jgi:hypothetical protein